MTEATTQQHHHHHHQQQLIVPPKASHNMTSSQNVTSHGPKASHVQQVPGTSVPDCRRLPPTTFKFSLVTTNNNNNNNNNSVRTSTNGMPLPASMRRQKAISGTCLPGQTTYAGGQQHQQLITADSSTLPHLSITHFDPSASNSFRGGLPSNRVLATDSGLTGAGLPRLQPDKGRNRSRRGERTSRNRDDDKENNTRARRVKDQPQLPLTPAEARKLYGSRLNAFEDVEIQGYSEIWFLGLGVEKICGVEGAASNNGYDDEHGSYMKVMGDHLAYRYEVLELLGKGSFGQVIKAYDHKTGQYVAIKIIRNKKRFHHQSLVEIKILDALRNLDADDKFNIIHMTEFFQFRGHLCIVFELMGANLYELIKMNKYQGFSTLVVKRLAGSMIDCLRLLSSENIIHCDLKPENILVRQQNHNSIKVIDFGSSCYEHERVYTYIQSRFYRAPEIILGLPYTTAIDMWSLGCVIAELLAGYPLFPGENEADQLACIMEVVGLPPDNVLENASRKKLFFDSRGAPRCVPNSRGKYRKAGTRDLARAVKSSDPLLLDFLSRCFAWNPADRLTPDEAARHEWLREVKFQRPRISNHSRGISDLKQQNQDIVSSAELEFYDKVDEVDAGSDSWSLDLAADDDVIKCPEVVECYEEQQPTTTTTTTTVTVDSGISSSFLPPI